MEPAVIAALIAAIVTSFGWMINHILSDRRERFQRQTEGRLKQLERQLEELYGPLAFLIHEGEQTFRDLLAALGRRFVFYGDEPLHEDDLRTWLFWAENSFIPRNESIKNILMSKTHLIPGDHFPLSYVTFLNHHNSWIINHDRWKKEGVAYSWHSSINWPKEFDQEVLSTFASLKRQHSQLLGQLTDLRVTNGTEEAHRADPELGYPSA